MAKYLLHIRLIEAKNIPPFDHNGFCDPYVKFKLGKEKKKSAVKDKTLFPVYNEEFTFAIHEEKQIRMELWEKDRLRKQYIGFHEFDLAAIEEKGVIHEWWSLHSAETKKPIPGAAINVAFVVDKENKDVKSKQLPSLRHSLTYNATKKRLEYDADEKVDSKEKLSIFIGSWNVGNAAPPTDLSPWVPKTGYDIFAIGSQECKYDAREGHSSCAQDWVESWKAHFGSDYHLLGQSHLWQIRLVIFVRNKFVPFIHGVEASTEATGIASVMGNKGGTVIAFSLHDLSLCFVNTHLAAHQGKVAERNADVAEVIKNIKMEGKLMDIVNQYHHVFWCGDLNYRIDWGTQGDKEKPSQEDFDSLCAAIKKKDWKTLYEKDQLALEMKEERVFVGFREGFPDYFFAPTFKVARSTELEYEVKRSPAWCDRILYRSFPGFEVKQLGFEGAFKIGTSDHKPVFGTYNVSTFTLPDGYDPTLGNCTMLIRNLKGKRLPAGDVGGASDPYVEFHGNFIHGNVVKTARKKKTLNPEWTDKEVPAIRFNINSKKRFATSFMFIRVFDHDVASASDLLCSGVLPLKGFLDGKRTPFKLPLNTCGLPAGEIEGEVEMFWEKPPKHLAPISPAPSPATSPSSSPASSPEKEKKTH